MTTESTFVMLALVGPSGTGKSTLARRLLTDHPDLALSVSYTTRAPRGNEVDGKDYHFVSREHFVACVEAGELLEWADVHGNLYGTGSRPIEAARRTHGGMVFDIDYQGARQIRARVADLVVVFVLPPSMDELERRLRGRGTDDEPVIARRMRKAAEEVEHYGLADYVLINDELQRTYVELSAILTAERTRRSRRAEFVERMLAPAGVLRRSG